MSDPSKRTSQLEDLNPRKHLRGPIEVDGLLDFMVVEVRVLSSALGKPNNKERGFYLRHDASLNRLGEDRQAFGSRSSMKAAVPHRHRQVFTRKHKSRCEM